MLAPLIHLNTVVQEHILFKTALALQLSTERSLFTSVKSQARHIPMHVLTQLQT